MIYTGNIQTLDPTQYDIIWVICRSVSEIKELFYVYSNIVHVPELAPSIELFKWYRQKFHSGKWDKKAFEEYYIPVFIQNLQDNMLALELLEQLIELSFEQDILLTCFCNDEAICHRSILAGVLSNMGAMVDCSTDYRKYHIDKVE